MPFDGRIIETNPDIVICDAAIEALRRYGWLRDRLGDQESGFCILGAIDYAARSDQDCGGHRGLVCRHRDIINPLLRRRMGDALLVGETPSVGRYNDRVVRRRTQAIRFLAALRNGIQKKLLHSAPAPSL